MPAVSMSFEHGQTPDVARARFREGIDRAKASFGMWVRQVDWSEDHSSAHLTGPGFALDMTVDDRHVHVKGGVPIPPIMLEGPVRRFLQQTFKSPS